MKLPGRGSSRLHLRDAVDHILGQRIASRLPVDVDQARRQLVEEVSGESCRELSQLLSDLAVVRMATDPNGLELAYAERQLPSVDGLEAAVQRFLSVGQTRRWRSGSPNALEVRLAQIVVETHSVTDGFAAARTLVDLSIEVDELNLDARFLRGRLLQIEDYLDMDTFLEDVEVLSSSTLPRFRGRALEMEADSAVRLRSEYGVAIPNLKSAHRLMPTSFGPSDNLLLYSLIDGSKRDQTKAFQLYARVVGDAGISCVAKQRSLETLLRSIRAVEGTYMDERATAEAARQLNSLDEELLR